MRGTIDGRRGKCGCECEMQTKQSQSDAGEGSSECKSSGRKKREKMKKSIRSSPRDGEIALSKSCANDSLLPFFFSAAASLQLTQEGNYLTMFPRVTRRFPLRPSYSVPFVISSLGLLRQNDLKAEHCVRARPRKSKRELHLAVL